MKKGQQYFWQKRANHPCIGGIVTASLGGAMFLGGAIPSALASIIAVDITAMSALMISGLTFTAVGLQFTQWNLMQHFQLKTSKWAYDRLPAGETKVEKDIKKEKGIALNRKEAECAELEKVYGDSLGTAGPNTLSTGVFGLVIGCGIGTFGIGEAVASINNIWIQISIQTGVSFLCGFSLAAIIGYYYLDCVITEEVDNKGDDVVKKAKQDHKKLYIADALLVGLVGGSVTALSTAGPLLLVNLLPVDPSLSTGILVLGTAVIASFSMSLIDISFCKITEAFRPMSIA